ncbi:hypothetical protein KIF59_06300 [Enterobacter cloacae subsp. cloacae]|nr:hypothetical protein [Enterobacter cloacae subsp. cloacae]
MSEPRLLLALGLISYPPPVRWRPAVTSPSASLPGRGWTLPVQTLLLLSGFTFIPAVLLMMTGFTRIILCSRVNA